MFLQPGELLDDAFAEFVFLVFFIALRIKQIQHRIDQRVPISNYIPTESISSIVFEWSDLDSNVGLIGVDTMSFPTEIKAAH